MDAGASILDEAAAARPLYSLPVGSEKEGKELSCELASDGDGLPRAVAALRCATGGGERSIASATGSNRIARALPGLPVGLGTLSPSRCARESREAEKAPACGFRGGRAT